MAGLTVLGFNPLKSGSAYAFETPNINGRARELTGQEREDALNRAGADNSFGKYAGFLESENFDEVRTDATVYLVEAPGYPTVLMISVPFRLKGGSITAQVKHVRHSNRADSIMGIVRSGNGQYDDVHVHEIVGGVVKHTKTLTWRDGNVIEEPVGQSRTMGSSSAVIATVPNYSEGCHICLTICNALSTSGGCGLTGLLTCTALCLPIGTVACPIICGLLFVVYCVWLSSVPCASICGPEPVGFGYCS